MKEKRRADLPIYKLAAPGKGSPLVERTHYNVRSEADVLLKQVRQHNEAFKGRGLKFLRSFVVNVSKIPEFATVLKPIVRALEGPTPFQDCVKASSMLLSQKYDSAGEQFIASQAALFVRKYPFEGSDALARSRATLKFLRGERKNALMNRLCFRRRIVLNDPRRSIPGDDAVLDALVRKHVARIIGEQPNHRMAAKLTGWGPGANVGVSGQFTNFARKLLVEEWTVTPAAFPYVLSAAKRSPMFWELLGLTKVYPDTLGTILCVDDVEFERRMLARVVFVDHNVIAFVPKNADEHRTIAKEPLLNSWIQKGYDEVMRLSLRRYGIDLRYQEPNQELARKGSLGGSNPYCTIDLRNASGSIAVEVPRTLLSPEWFATCNCIRSPAYRMPESDVSTRYAGFVSMGNGTCFPLQTTIFAAICASAHELVGSAPDFRCYGDDIIVRRDVANVVLDLLRRYGFAANPDKTFLEGPFRESCGADWYNGEDVRPVYVDTSLDSIEERVRLHNAFCRLPNRWAAPLASAMALQLPPFMSKFVRPFPDETDEAIDGRHMHLAGPHRMITREGAPGWYGFSFNPVKDKEIEGHAQYHTALLYGALKGSDSSSPFTARRETRMRVARFSHSGNTSNWLPEPQTRFPALSALLAYIFVRST